MGGWRIDKENAEDDFFAEVKILHYSEEGCRFELTTKKKEEEPVQGAAN